MAMLLQRVALGADAMSAREALEIATLGGAQVLGRTDLGQIMPGKRADLAVWDLRGVEAAGSWDPVAALALCGPTRSMPPASTRAMDPPPAPTVVAAARQFFKLPAEDARFSIHIGCGAQFVLDHDQEWDYVLVDGFDRNARAGVLDTEPFHQAVRARLSKRGIMAVNLFGRARGYRTSLERIVRAYDDRAIAFPSCDSGNVVAFGADGEPIARTVDELRERARVLKSETGLDLGPTVSRLEQSGSLPGGRLLL